jgi:uncharacterized protein (DUF58 family)
METRPGMVEAASRQITVERPLPLLGTAMLLIVAVFLPHRIWTTLLIGFGGLALLSFAWTWALRQGLHAERRLRFGWVSVGDRLEERFFLYNQSPFPALWIEVIDHSNVPGYRPAVVQSVGSGDRQQWRQAAVCRRRGQFHLGPWAIRSGDPFGLFTITCHYPHAEEIIIHPPIHGQLPIPLPAGRRSGRTRTQERHWRATVNAAGVRDYQSGDPLSWVHWPTSARRDDLFVRQFDRDTAGDIWLLLDMAGAVQLGDGPEGTEEQAILLAAALTAQGLHQNRGVGLAAYGRSPQIAPPAKGEGQRWRLLRALALIRADGDTPLHRALAELAHTARRGAAAVIITPRGDADWIPHLLTLSRRGLRPYVILLDRASFGEAGRRSAALAQIVQGLGVTCHRLRRGDMGSPPETETRRGFWEFKVTGTGKVVAVQTPGGEERGNAG